MSPNDDDIDHSEDWMSDPLDPDSDFGTLYQSILILRWGGRIPSEHPQRPLSSSSEAGPSTACFPILELPSELRLLIYEYALAELRPKSHSSWWFSIINGKLPPAPCPALFLVSRQITAEAIPIYFGSYEFQFRNMKILNSFLQERPLQQLASIKHVTVAAHPKLDFNTFDYEDDVKTWRLLVERCTRLRELWLETMLSSNIYRNGVAGMEVLNDLRGLKGGGLIESVHGRRAEVEFEWMQRLRELWKMPKPVQTGITS